MPDPRKTPPSDNELRDLVQSLVNGWQLAPDEALDVRGADHPALVATLWGLAAHAHECGQAVVSLVDAGLPPVVMAPLVRTVLECGVAAHWLIRVKDGTESILNESLRQQRAFHATLDGIPRPHFEPSDDAKVAAAGPGQETTSGQSARVFAEMCKDLNPGGEELYANYRALSMMCHAGDHLVDLYATLRAGGAFPPITIRVHPREDPDLLPYLLWVTGNSLVWAGRAVDVKRPSHPRRSEIAAAAAELSVQMDLKASERVWLREHPGG